MSIEEQKQKSTEIMSILQNLSIADIKTLLTDILEVLDENSILKFCTEE